MIFSIQKPLLKIVIVLFSLIIVAGVFYYFFYYLLPINYLIPGVPYYGYYNHFYDIDSAEVAAVYSILNYWGDNRFSLSDLRNKFVLNESGRYKSLDEYFREVNTVAVEDFFDKNGYETFRWVSEEPGGEIRQIKKFVNSNKKVPVIVYQKRSVNEDNSLYGFRLVIGIFDKEQKVVAHDYYSGNNYEISYENFNSMFKTNGRAILAVWPKEDLLPKLSPPNRDTNYPVRWPEMADLGELLLKRAQGIRLNRLDDYQQALKTFEEFLSDPNLAFFPPSLKVSFYDYLGYIYLNLKQPDQAIATIKNSVLPINHDLNQAFEKWPAPVGKFKEAGYTENKAAEPYYVLGLAYLAKVNKKLAEENFKEALKIYPNHKASQQALEGLKNI